MVAYADEVDSLRVGLALAYSDDTSEDIEGFDDLVAKFQNPKSATCEIVGAPAPKRINRNSSGTASDPNLGGGGVKLEDDLD